MNNRFKNIGLWISIFAFIPLLADGLGYDILPNNYEEIVKSFLDILVIAGILNNPSSNNPGFMDDK